MCFGPGNVQALPDRPQSRPGEAPTSVPSMPRGMDGTELHRERSHAQRTSKQDRHRNNCGRRRYCRRVRCQRRPSSHRGARSERFTRGRICRRELHRQRRLTARAPTIFGGALNMFTLTGSRLSFLHDGILSGVGSVAHGPPTGCHSPEVGPMAAHRPTRCVWLTGAPRPPHAPVSLTPVATNTRQPGWAKDFSHLIEGFRSKSGSSSRPGSSV